jgi:hypothetical protein
MELKKFAIKNARIPAYAEHISRAGNSIEWFKCTCGEQSNLLWVYKDNKSRILACSLDCAVEKVASQIRLNFLVA